MNMQHVNVNA